MKDQVTIVAADARRLGSQSLSAALTPRLYAQIRGRVRLLALMSAVGFALGPAVFLFIVFLSTFMGELPPEAWEGVQFLWLHGAAVLLSLILWQRARSADVSPDSLLWYGQAYLVVSCLLIGIMTYWSEYREVGQLPRLTWIPAVIILFPLILPGPPRRMLWGAAAAGAMTPLSLAILDFSDQISTTSSIYLSGILNSGLAVAFSYVGARTVYGLGKEVVEARRLGSYRLESRLGAGGMGEVWRARHGMLARPAAIKLIRPEILHAEPSGAEMALERFEREAQATAGLRSPHTVELYDFGQADDGTFYYVMELLEGLDIATLVDRYGPVPADRAVHVLRQVCRSLSEAHGHGLIHRDIKPANIYLCRYGEEYDFAKVLDFGLVKQVKNGTGLPLDRTSEFIGGTPAFMAPEQALGSRPIDGRADIYALGCVAYWLLAGQYVFSGETPMEVLTKHVSTPPVAVSERTELPIPAALEQTVMACLEKDPERRPSTSGVLFERLGELDIAGAWTQDRARAWWDLHAPTSLETE